MARPISDRIGSRMELGFLCGQRVSPAKTTLCPLREEREGRELLFGRVPVFFFISSVRPITSSTFASLAIVIAETLFVDFLLVTFTRIESVMFGVG